MQKIIPHLWFDKEAKQAAEFYATVFPNSRVKSVQTLRDTPSGDTEIVSFEVLGYSFMAISAGPLFRFNPSISFMINFDPSQDKDAKTRIDEVWGKLSHGGNVLMPIQKYPFSERYGWVADKYGVSWQLILTNPEGEVRPPLIPSLMFVGKVCGKAEEATDFYISTFKNSKRGQLVRYGKDNAPDEEGSVMFTDFTLEGQWFVAMDSAHEHKFAFNEAISLMVNCDDQKEIDYYWGRLSAVRESEQCGWLKDKYGVSWQISPKVLAELMKGDQAQVDRVTQAFLKMKKFDIAELERAAQGRELVGGRTTA
jgi:predicted 3-demethylubiquinone-9 3-methyltransferase (glyoxalase superfamily)